MPKPTEKAPIDPSLYMPFQIEEKAVSASFFIPKMIKPKDKSRLSEGNFDKSDPDKDIVPFCLALKKVQTSDGTDRINLSPDSKTQAVTSIIYIPPKEKVSSPNKEQKEEEKKVIRPESIQTSSIYIPTANVKFDLLERLLEFLKNKNDPNPVLAGYVAKVFCSIINMKKAEVWAYLLKNSMHLDNIVRFGAHPSLGEIMTRILSGTEESVKDPNFSTRRQDIILRLLKEACANAGKQGQDSNEGVEKNCQIVCELTKSQIEIDYLISKESQDLIFKIISQGKTKPGLKLLMALICQVKEEERNLKLFILIENSIKSMRILLHNLEIPGEIGSEIQEGIIYDPLGKEKLIIVEYFQAIIKLNNQKILQCFEELKVPIILLKLLGKYYRHSILHLHIFSILEVLFKDEAVLQRVSIISLKKIRS